jgi:hypothetical protein
MGFYICHTGAFAVYLAGHPLTDGMPVGANQQ